MNKPLTHRWLLALIAHTSLTTYLTGKKTAQKSKASITSA